MKPIYKIMQYSQAPLYGHSLNMDTSLLRTGVFVPGESPYFFSKFNSLTRTTDTCFLLNQQNLIEKSCNLTNADTYQLFIVN